MKFSQIGRVALASVLSLGACLGISACTTAYTGAYLYVTSTRSNPGVVNAFKVDSVSGALYILPDSPFPAGRNPVGLVMSPNGKQLYVVNHDDSTVIQYDTGTDGKIYAQHTYNTTGGLPTSVAIDPTGQYLLVAFTYQLGYTTASPGPGGVDVFPINTDGSLVTTATDGTNPGHTAVAVGCNPVSVYVAPANNFVYVLDQNYTPSPATCVATSSTPANSPIANVPLVLGFSLNTSKTSAGGSLTSLPGSTTQVGVSYPGYPAGAQPSSLLVDPSAKNVYVSDESADAIYSYAIQPNGTLVPNASTSTGVAPVAATQISPLGLTMSPNGSFLFVANYGSNNVGTYAVGAGGTLSSLPGSALAAVGTNPDCLTISSHGEFLFATNYTSSNVSALQLNSSTGNLINVESTPFPTAGFPTCAATVTAAGH